MFNALTLSYTRLPMALAEDGLLPAALARRNRRGVPWVAVLACAVAWALALGFSFERLISLDLILYGASLILEFLALVVLRLREPQLERPFRAGNLACACLIGAAPTALIVWAAGPRAANAWPACPRCCSARSSPRPARCSSGCRRCCGLKPGR